MSASNPRLLARLAALEGFREEQLRQQLALGHRNAHAARQQQEQHERALLGIEAARHNALALGHGDIARYALYAEWCGVASERLEQSIEAAKHAQTQVDEASTLWALGRARRGATQERAKQAKHAAMEYTAQKQAADAMDLWLGREQ